MNKNAIIAAAVVALFSAGTASACSCLPSSTPSSHSSKPQKAADKSDFKAWAQYDKFVTKDNWRSASRNERDDRDDRKGGSFVRAGYTTDNNWSSSVHSSNKPAAEPARPVAESGKPSHDGDKRVVRVNTTRSAADAANDWVIRDSRIRDDGKRFSVRDIYYQDGPKTWHLQTVIGADGKEVADRAKVEVRYSNTAWMTPEQAKLPADFVKAHLAAIDDNLNKDPSASFGQSRDYAKKLGVEKVDFGNFKRSDFEQVRVNTTQGSADKDFWLIREVRARGDDERVRIREVYYQDGPKTWHLTWVTGRDGVEKIDNQKVLVRYANGSWMTPEQAKFPADFTKAHLDRINQNLSQDRNHGLPGKPEGHHAGGNGNHNGNGHHGDNDHHHHPRPPVSAC